MSNPDPVRWSVLTIGHLSRNRFWGEDDSRARRGPLCTSVLVWTGDAVLLVDPSLPPGDMPGLLDRRTGLTPNAVLIAKSRVLKRLRKKLEGLVD